MKKLIAIVIAIVFAAAVVVVNVSAAPNPNASDRGVDNANIPEVSGDYAIRGRPDLRVRVFVHGPKSGNHTTSITVPICEDNDSEAVIGWAGWKLPNSTVTYRLNQSSAPSGIRSSVPGFVSNSFSKWTNAITLDSSTSAKPTLVSGSSTSNTRSRFDGQNIIAWGRTSGSTLGVTYVWYYTASLQVAEVDTIMNSRVSWNLACSTSYYNAENIMIHELGHWFGLDDEYDGPFVENTMYGYGSKAEVKKITPENGDISGLNLIY